MFRPRLSLTPLCAIMVLAGLLTWRWASPALGQPIMQAQPGGVVQVFPPMQGPNDPVAPPFSGGEDNRKAAQFSSLRLLEKSEYRNYIKAATEALEDKAWDDCVVALQRILDEPGDNYVQVKEKSPSGQESVRWASVKFEAHNLLNKMPVEGLDVYEQKNGAKRDLLVKARDTGKQDYLIEAATKYLHTKSGAEANEILATLLLDRGQYFMSALRFEKQLQLNQNRFKVEDLTLFKTSLAYARAGDKKKAEGAWKQLEGHIRDRGSLKVGEEMVSLDNLSRVIENGPKRTSIDPADWPLIGGNLMHSAQAAGSPPWLDMQLWRRPMFFDKEADSTEVDAPGEREAANKVQEAVKKSDNVAVLPGCFPVTANKVLVYRTPKELRAVALVDMKGVKAGEILWKSTEMDGSLVSILDDAHVKSTFQSWMHLYGQTAGFSSYLYDNTLVGTLSTDHRNVYAIDDLMVPAHPQTLAQYRNMGFNGGIGGMGGVMTDKVRPLVGENVLYAFDIFDGRARWNLGGGNIRISKDAGSTAVERYKKDPFNESHFLGAPLPVGNKLYVLNEKNQGMTGESDLRLVCIDPTKVSKEDSRPHIVDIQTLGSIREQDRVTHNMARRTHAVHLAYAEGILVCPTHTGEILGVELMSKSLVWSYPYREQQFGNVQAMDPNGGFFPGGGRRGMPQNLAPPMANWKSAPPVIQDGKVVFTAPDAHSVHCVNLRDGTFRWKKKQLDGDLYLAGIVNNKVIVVGKNTIRGLSLDDGRLLWNLATGDVPSGHGVANKGVYYLPLHKGELLAVDVERGIVKAHNRAKKSGVVPGNLIFSDGAVISVTTDDITAFPQLQAKLNHANDSIKEAPRNPNNLFIRGELLLADGQVQAAVNDLEAALASQPSADLTKRVKNKLYEGLTDLLQTDFDRSSPRYLKTYEELCSIADDKTEKQEREAMYYRIVGQGREGQGQLVEAFQMYRQFGALPIHEQRGGITSLEDPTHKIPVPVWLRGRVSAMIAKATPEQRKPLEEKIAQEWKAVEAQKNPQSIRTFISMFDVPFAVGREARLKLAETLIERNERASFLEAELCLLQLRGEEYRKEAQSGGRALAALALLEEKKNTNDSMKQAAAYYRQLAKEYPTAIVRQDKDKGRTGSDLFNELATDKRFWPYLEETKSLWADAKIAARDMNGSADIGSMQGVVFYPEGDHAAVLTNHRLVVECNNTASPKIRLVDIHTLKERWKFLPGNIPANQMFYDYLNRLVHMPVRASTARFRTFHVKGNTLVVQLGIMVYCLDLDKGDKRWEHSLMELPPNSNVQFQADNEGNMEMFVWNQMQQIRTRTPIGMVGAVQPGYVALVGNKGLQVFDPLKGERQWQKIDVTSSTRIFGDDQYLFLVEVSDSGSVGVGRILCANDGQQVALPDFGNIYQHRVAVQGRRILAAVPTGDEIHLKLHDIVSGKDLWSKAYPKGHLLMKSDDPAYTGTLNPANGDVTIYDAQTGALLLTSNVAKGRIAVNDLQSVKEPLLLADPDRFYIALNQPVEANKISGGVINNNFQTGLRSLPVHGWFVALQRKDGSRKIGDVVDTWKKGDLAWHSIKPIHNQMILMEQFERIPILIFTSRYNELIAGGVGGNQWISHTQTIHKQSGKAIHDPETRRSNGSPQFYAFVVDVKSATMTLMGYTGVLQHYVDDGRKRDIGPQGATSSTRSDGPPYVDPKGVPIPPNGAAIIRRGGIQVMPLPALPPPPVQAAPPAPLPVPPRPE